MVETVFYSVLPSENRLETFRTQNGYLNSGHQRGDSEKMIEFRDRETFGLFFDRIEPFSQCKRIEFVKERVGRHIRTSALAISKDTPKTPRLGDDHEEHAQ